MRKMITVHLLFNTLATVSAGILILFTLSLLPVCEYFTKKKDLGALGFLNTGWLFILILAFCRAMWLKSTKRPYSAVVCLMLIVLWALVTLIVFVFRVNV